MSKVLVAEDEEDIQFLCTAWLKREGHDVTTDDNDLEAITAFDTAEFDFVVLDVMPPEVDGLEVWPAQSPCRQTGDPEEVMLCINKVLTAA